MRRIHKPLKPAAWGRVITWCYRVVPVSRTAKDLRVVTCVRCHQAVEKAIRALPNVFPTEADR